MRSISFVAITIILWLGLACKLGSLVSGGNESYTSVEDKFSVNFPGGADDVETKSRDGLKATGPGKSYEKSFDNRSDNYRSYEVTAYSLDPPEDLNERDILVIGLNGWEDEPETTVKDAKINGQNALDSVRSIEVGPAKMTFREVVFWNEKEKKLCVVQVSATKKENVSTQAANDFVNSFKFTP